MPFVPVPFTTRCVINMVHTAVPVVSTFDVGDDDHGLFGEPGYFDGLAEDLWNNWKDEVMPHLANAVHLISVTVQSQHEEDGEQGLYTAAEVVGGIAQQSLPANVAMIVRKRTARAGRNFAGRWFLPGITEQEWQGGGQTALPGAYVTAFNADLEDFLDGIEDGGRIGPVPQRHMVVASRFDGVDPITHLPIPREEGETARVTSLTLNPLIGTMRKRIKR